MCACENSFLSIIVVEIKRCGGFQTRKVNDSYRMGKGEGEGGE